MLAADKKIFGFTIIELIISVSIVSLLFSLIIGVYFFYSKNINNSIKKLSAETKISEFYITLDTELNSRVQNKKIKFDDLIGNFFIEFYCQNPYQTINAPILKIRYSKQTDYTNINYFLKKEVFALTSEQSKDEIKLYETISLKNCNDINIEMFLRMIKITDESANSKIDKIAISINYNNTLYHLSFNLDKENNF